MKFKGSFKINVIFNSIYQILAILTPLITTPYISRIFDSDLIGKYSFLYSIVSYFTMFATYGFVDYGTKLIAENRNDTERKSKIFSCVFYSKLLFSTIVLFSYVVLLLIFTSDITSFYLLLTMSLYIFTILIDPLFYFQGNEEFVSISIRNIIIRLLSVILVFLLVKDSDDIILYSLILSAGNFLAVIIMLFSLKGKVKFVKISFKDLLLVFKKSFPYFLPLLTNTLSMYGYQTILGMFGSDSDSGLYAQATKFTSLIIGIISSLSVIVLSRISFLNKASQSIEFEKKTNQIARLFWLVSLPAFAGLMYCNQYLIPWFFGDGYIEVIPLIYIMGACVIFSSLNTLIINLYYRPFNKIKGQMNIIIFTTIFGIILALVLIYFYGAIGCAIATVMTDTIRSVLFIYNSRKNFCWKKFFKQGVIPLFSTLIMCIFLLTFMLLSSYILQISNFLNLVILVSIGLIVYFISLILFKEPFATDMINKVLHWRKK